MRIKPVLVPDHTANDLRRLMDHFAEAATGPTKRQLTESRSAVTAAQKTINEGFMDTVKQAFNDCVVGYPQGTSDGQFIQGWARAIRAETGRDISLEKLTQLYQDYVERSDEIMQSHGTTNEEQGVTEGEGMSRAAKGYEKYGRAGMAALAAAGREGRDLDKIRDRYDRYDEGVEEGTGAMPVNKYIAQELDTLLKLAQDQVDDITNRSRDGYGNKKSSGLEDAIFELSGVSNGFHSSMAEGVAELQELNSGLPRIGNWIMRNLKKVGNRIDLPQLIKQETSNNQGVTETHDEDDRAVLRNRIVADVLNFYSLNDRIPSIKEFSRPVRAKLNALEFDERSTVFRQAVVQALKLLGKQGMSAALTLDEHGDPWEDPNYDPRGGGETRSPEQIAKDNAEHAILSKKLGLKNTNKLPDIKDDMLKMMNHFMRQHSEKKDVTETADGVKYGVFAKGGSIGSQKFKDDPVKTFDTKEEATADARRRRSGLSKGERGYYGMGYVVKPIRGEVDEGMIDNIKNTVRAANYDRLARRSNSQAVAGGGLAPPAQFRALSDKGDQRAQKAQDIRKGDAAQQVEEGIDPIEQLRADIRRFAQ